MTKSIRTYREEFESTMEYYDVDLSRIEDKQSLLTELRNIRTKKGGSFINAQTRPLIGKWLSDFNNVVAPVSGSQSREAIRRQVAERGRARAEAGIHISTFMVKGKQRSAYRDARGRFARAPQ